MKKLPLLIAILLCGCFTVANASVLLQTNSATFGANDIIDWLQLGENATWVSSPSTVSSVGGMNATVSDVNNSPLGRINQNDPSGFGWEGNFASGAPLLWAYGSGPITITFSSPVMGAGMQIQDRAFGNFVATISAFDSQDNLLGSFSENGISSMSNVNSAIFIGLFSDSFDIAKIAVDVPSAPFPAYEHDFAINNVSLVSLVPEPSSIVLAGLGGLVCFGTLHRKRLFSLIADL